MAESIVSAFVVKLSFLMAEEANFLLGVEEKLMFLRDELEWIRHFLGDAEKKRRKSQLVEVWMAQIRDLAYDAEDVIDLYMLHVEHRRTKNLVGKIIHAPKKLVTLYRVGKKIEQINTRARKISACKSDYNLVDSETTHDSGASEDRASRRRSIPTAEVFDIVGFKKESAQVINWVKDEVPQRQVMSIIGMGGLGKTTLARIAYKSKDVSSHFDARTWISVSEEYQVRDLLISALKQVMTDATDDDHSRLENMDAERLKEEVYKKLHDKRYLVVIDDIWKIEAWDQIIGAFPNNKRGSRIILTTRNKEIALHADPRRRFHLELRLLNKDESWELLCKKVFLMSSGCPPELVKIGKEIVSKCVGLPLAIVVIGGILLGKEWTHDAWSKLLDSATWQLSQDSNQCREILLLSYIDLPYYLKSCFLYFGLFPEDFEIEAKKLILLWVAEGFVQARGEQKMEEVAEDCLEELIQRNMIQVTRRMYHGGPVEWCRIHDLLRDLAISEARKERFMDIHTNNYSSTSSTGSRRLAIHSSKSSEYQHAPTLTAPKLRSLFLFDSMFEIGMYWKSLFGDGKRLIRVLDLEGVTLCESLLEEIGELIFLHYLGLRSTKIQWLPTSIGNLLKLQTLDVRDSGIRSLPEAIWKLKNLRHLWWDKYCKEFELVNDVGGKDFGKNLLTLDVSGSIWMTKDGGGLSDALVKLQRLRSLSVCGEIVVNDYEKLRNYFPSSLTELRLYLSELKQDPSHVLGSLPKLKTLYLFRWSYTGGYMVFNRGEFPCLQVLHLSSLENLIEWRVEDGAMPNLRHLRTERCYKLMKLPDGLRRVATLQNIEILTMPTMFVDRVKENGQDWEIIKHVPSITIHDTYSAWWKGTYQTPLVQADGAKWNGTYQTPLAKADAH